MVKRHSSEANGLLMEHETHFVAMTQLSYTKIDKFQTALGPTDEMGRILAGLASELTSTLCTFLTHDT